MIRKSIAMILIGLVGVIPAYADIKKGQRSYLKKCKRCHGNGTKGASMKTQSEWNELFEFDAELIIEKHEDSKVSKWFSGKRFQKYAPHLKDFLFHYASDSGNVPSCG